MLSEETVLEEIRRWHEGDRRAGIKRAFALGDLILKAVIHTGKTEWDIVNRIIADLGELALGASSYTRAARLAKVFTKGQRAVLIDKAVHLMKAEVLASEHYDGRARSDTICEIKSGKITAPWSCIVGAKASGAKREKAGGTAPHENERENSANNPDNIVVPVARNGVPDEEVILNVFKNLISRIGPDRARRLCVQAFRELGHSI